MGVDIIDRVDELMARMSLEQKLGQMVQTERMVITPEQVRDRHIGSVLSGGGSCPGDNRPEDWVSMNDAYWQASMDDSNGRLAIPIIYGVDAIHGHNNVRGATIFPHNIGLGATGDVELLERIARVTALEVLATGVDWTFAPTLAVARDPRWGRTYESYSESPERVAAFSGAFVRGLQGDLGDAGIAACAKHWVGDGGTSEGIEQGDTRVSESELRRVHVAPYLPALQAGVLSIMVSFNSWNGEKCHGHRWLVTELLKGELGFGGLVISDWDGIDYIDDDYGEAVAKGVEAGIDMFMLSEHWELFLERLASHVRSGRVPLARIDDAVRRILGVKFALGLFEKPRPAERPWSLDASFGSPAHRDVAREAVRKSLVLLHDDGGLLPLSDAARVLVAGRHADDVGVQCGGFTVAWQGTTGNEEVEGGTSIWAGIREMAPAAELCADGSSADPARHDIAVVVIGETPYAEGMGDIRTGDDVVVREGSRIRGTLKVLEPYGASLSLSDLHPEDLHVIERIRGRGIPVVTVLICGRPLEANAEIDASGAFVVVWLPGSEGLGVAEVLFGREPFTGKLSFAWPDTAEAPVWQGDQRADARFPRGHGLAT